jgi:hypothetical protein
MTILNPTMHFIDVRQTWAGAATDGQRGGGGGRKATRGGGKGGERRRRRGRRGKGGGECCANRNRRNKKTLCATMVEGSPEKKPLLEPRRKTLIGDEPSVGSTNRRHRDDALDETSTAVPSVSADNAQIESN